jgi:hypothetical protein
MKLTDECPKDWKIESDQGSASYNQPPPMAKQASLQSNVGRARTEALRTLSRTASAVTSFGMATSRNSQTVSGNFSLMNLYGAEWEPRPAKAWLEISSSNASPLNSPPGLTPYYPQPVNSVRPGSGRGTGGGDGLYWKDTSGT